VLHITKQTIVPMASFIDALFCDRCGANMIAPGVRARCATLSAEGCCPKQTDVCQQCLLKQIGAATMPPLLYPRMTMSPLPADDGGDNNETERPLFAIVRFSNTGTATSGDQRYLFCIDCAYAVAMRDWYTVRAVAWQRRHAEQRWPTLMQYRQHLPAAQRTVETVLQPMPTVECFVAP
jgi:hypothetical protein